MRGNTILRMGEPKIHSSWYTLAGSLDRTIEPETRFKPVEQILS
jgi:hypothetical protein